MRYILIGAALVAGMIGVAALISPGVGAQKLPTPTPTPAPPAPNLVAGLSCTPLYANDGAAVQCQVSVVNRADATAAAVVPAGAKLARATLSPSANATVSGATASGGAPGAYACSVSGGVVDCVAQTPDTLAPGETRSFIIRFTAGTLAGTSTVTVQSMADPDGVISETNETDNPSGVKTVTVCPAGAPCIPTK